MIPFVMARVTKVITINVDQERWLSEHPEINLSGFVQKELRKLMEGGKSEQE
jgi:hypothetical protein